MKTLLGPIGCCLVLLATANCISEQCKLYEQTTMMCRCVGNEEFFLPDGYNYENVTSLQIASCNSANLHHSSLISTNRIAEVIVQNISERLIFELYLMSKKLKRLKLSNVGWIPSITQDTFVNLGGIESVWLENTRIDHLEEQFASIAVNDFTMINVTIERIDELNFSEKGNILRIEDSVFRNVTGPLNFADFAIVKILRSEFRLQKPGHVWIESDLVQIKDSIFSNASTNVVATNNIWLHANCADGKSSIRLSSTKIKSVNNRLPTEIVYKGNKSDAEHFVKRNNTKLNTTIRFFNRTDYYTLHGSDALFAAQEVFKTTTVCKMLGSDPYKTEGVILNKNHFESFIRDLLLVRQYRIEVYTNQGTAKNQNWVLEYKGSPGNLTHFEDVLFGNNDVAVSVRVIAVKLGMDGKSRVVGLSCVDTTATLFSVCEFQDNESFSNLESLVVTLAPKECLLIQGEGSREFQTLKQVMERNNVMVTLKKKNEFSSESIVQDLNTLIKFKEGQQQNVQSLPEINLNLAMSATSALIKYLDLTSDEGNLNQFSMDQIEQSRYLRLDAAAMKALNIEPRIDTPSALNGNVPTSILTLLDKCRTPQGRRLLAQWVRQPLKDLSLIKERHDVVEALVNDNELRSGLNEDYLRRIPDLQVLAKKLSSKKATLQDLYKIYISMLHLPRLIERLTTVNIVTLRTMFTDPLTELVKNMDKFQQMVKETVDLDAAERGDFLVQLEFDDELKELKSIMNEVEEKLQVQLGKVADELSIEAGKTLKLESNQQFGYYFRVTLKDEKVLRNKKHYTILDSNKSGVRFRSNKLTVLNEEYIAAREKYTIQQKNFVTEIIEIAAGYISPIKAIGNLLASLDVFTAFASAAVSANIPYVRPEMLPSEAGKLNLIQVRHPCLEIQEGIDYIANDVSFEREQCHFSIVTGPNMGGKSTYIRSVGVAALMAHIGSFVPCDKAEISLLDCILARVGADDSQLKGLSTFMIEMIETAAVLRTATCNSLVLIDELGRGTSTYEGCGIAWSIAEYLAKNIECYCLFATHFHEITKLEEEVSAVKNEHVTALINDNKLTLLYKVKPGVCDQSFGIHVAKMANFPHSVIEFAKHKQAELEDYQASVFEGSDNSQKKQKIIKEAEGLISEFVNKCKKLDKSLSDEDLKDKISTFKKETLSHKNPYIEALLAAS